ncbi:MAG TPA: glycosyltransferase N-terminal domain-containing protein [Gemmatimonadaceae bacterium]|nr:glycosyltransferase N-terminal domain-containing protein [Gemmatimonadaceae bacterium]
MPPSESGQAGAPAGPPPAAAPPALWFLYRLTGGLARAASAITPAGSRKVTRSFAARRGIRARFRRWASAHRDPARPLLWMHAPSVGEGLQARPVLERLRARHPRLQLAYTHFSPSAAGFAASLPVDVHDYLPFDTPAEMRAALDAWRPTALVFSKLDVWPALAREAAQRGVRLGMISATLAETSARRGALASALLREAYARLDAVGAIDAADAGRLVALGVRPSIIEVTGDTRYDQVWARARAVSLDHPLISLLGSDRPTFIAGSTWPADERVLLPAWERVHATNADARLLLVPHEPTTGHLEPLDRWARDARLRVRRLSEPATGGDWDVLLVDRTGVLGELYALADVAYVGGGFHAAGLHSVLEPAAFGAPVLFGPRHAASRDAGLLLTAGAARVAPTIDAMAAHAGEWLAHAAMRREAGDAARAVVEAGLGAADRSTALVVRLLGLR